MATDLMIPDHFTTQFDSTWSHLVQQKESRLMKAVTRDTIKGDRKKYNQIASGSMSQITSRLQQTRIDQLDTKARWLVTKEYDEVTLFDEWDEEMLGEVVLPTSDTITKHVMSYRRTVDQTIIDALEGTAYIGDVGTDTVAVPSGQKVLVNHGGSNIGLTIAKLIEAKSILGKNEVDDMDPLYIVVSQQQLDDLLLANSANNPVTNIDMNTVRALVEGSIDRFMGFQFIRTELLTLNASTDVRTCIAFAKSGIKFADRRGGKTTRTDIRADLNHALQIRTVASMGATRTEEEKVVLIYADESP